MTFETYDPTKHTLEVGTKIRLAGREGKFQECDIDECPLSDLEVILFDDGGKEHIDIYKYTFEIAVSPLTIDKRVKGALVDIYNGPHDHETTLRMIYNYLNSLKET